MSTTRNEAIAVFLDGIVDYAGLFPPAEHDLDEALRRYFIYRAGPFSWMLGPFVIGLHQVEALSGMDVLQGEALALSVVLPADPKEGAWGDFLVTCFDSLRTWTREAAGPMFVDAIETRIPGSYGPADLGAEIVHALSTALEPPRTAYFEIPVDDTEQMGSTVEALTRARQATSQDVAGKVRTGGLTPADYPSTAAVADFITTCRDAGLPFKATAGIHHPVRHTDASGQARHGFLNIIAAGVLAREHEVSASVVEDVLIDEAAASFEFSESALWWRTWAVSSGAIARHRSEFVRSFGSCSFEDPVNDLIGLGHLVDPPGSEWTAATQRAPSGAR